MNNIYHDYSGEKTLIEEEENIQFRGNFSQFFHILHPIFLIILHLFKNEFSERRVSGSDLAVMEVKVKELTEENGNLQKQNNLLNLKIEILLDMLAQKSAEADFLSKDRDKMKNILMKIHPVSK